MTGEDAAPEWLERRAIFAAFGQTEAQAIEGYRAFVAAGKGQPSPWDALKRQVFLGSDAFVAAMHHKVPKARPPRGAPGETPAPSALVV